MNGLSDLHAGVSTFTKLKRLAEQIRPGMTRYQVERVLPRSGGGVQGPCITIYNELPKGRIEVPFDCTEGPGNDANRVIGAAMIFVAVSD